MKAITLCKHINKAFPEANAVTLDQFNGEDAINQDGIWFRSEGAVAPDGMPLHDYYSEHGPGFHKKLSALVEKNGFFLENYDAGTMMACRL
tara:strand:+ start:97 stop:369 length:273 start_codon:yes stop_codon:yes gene_type:complete